MSSTNELRVVVLAAEPADAGAVCAVSSEAGIAAEPYNDMDGLCSAIVTGAGAAVIGQEVLSPAAFEKLVATLRDQPAWSDFPVILIGVPTGGWTTGVEDVLGASAYHGNFVVLQRPLATEVLVSALRAALRGRTRQYELRRSYERLSESEARFRALLTASSDAMYRMSPDWTEMLHLHGPDFMHETDEPSGTWLQKYIPPADQEHVAAVINEAIRTRSTYALEHRVVRVDGSVGWTFSRAVPIQDATGEIVEWFGTATDITERKQSEERLRHAQKMESIGLLAGGIAHDFNNLLTVIMGAASVALGECPNCDSSMAIVSAAERASQLTKQLLAYAGKGEFIKKRIDISTLVAGSRPLLEASVPKRINLGFNLAEELPVIEGDPSRIDQILLNLVVNAGEAIARQSDGRVDVGTGWSDVTPEAARLHSRSEVAPGTYVWLEVRDNGAGMDNATLSRIFDPFFSTKFTGRGLGLAAVDGIVRSSKGFIEVESSPAQGSTFRVFLPAATDKRPSELELADERSAFRGAATVLVVDDEEMVRKMACMILRRHGHRVLEASDGKQALQVLAESPSLPSIVLLDLAMPIMGGDELIPILNAQYPALKVIVSSGYPDEETREEIRNASVAGFLTKPYTAVTLTDKVDEVLGEMPGKPGQTAESPKLGRANG